jgi:4-amino-4-deoxy-L-arabinose transferase-like glycosyltransferase
MGAGLALQLLTRPFEFVLLGAAVVLWIVWISHVKFAPRQIAVVAVFPAAALLLTGAQDKAVTGNWTTLPYMLSRHQYGVPATFTFQPNALPHRALTPEQELDYRAQSAIHGDGTDTFGAFFRRLGFRVRYYRFFLFPPLYVAALVFFLFARKRDDRWIIVTILLFALGTNFYPYFFAHYVAALTCLFVLLAVRGLERISRWKPQLSRLILLMCGAQFVFWYGLHAFAGENLWEGFHYEPSDFIDYGDPEGRIAVNAKLTSASGQQLVFVRYWPEHGFHEWVHNGADIDSSRIVWALDLGPEENQKLLNYFPQRNAWLLQPDAHPPILTPYRRP